MHAVSPPGARHCLQKPSSPPEAALRPETRPGEEHTPGRLLACAFCLRPVTTSAARIEVGGAHQHTFVNPHGFRYHIGCFATVVGCVPVGEPSAFWTWFPGHTWQIELCGNCREHLGWRFHAADSEFHGLVLDRLAEVEDAG